MNQGPEEARDSPKATQSVSSTRRRRDQDLRWPGGAIPGAAGMGQLGSVVQGSPTG